MIVVQNVEQYVAQLESAFDGHFSERLTPTDSCFTELAEEQSRNERHTNSNGYGLDCPLYSVLEGKC